MKLYQSSALVGLCLAFPFLAQAWQPYISVGAGGQYLDAKQNFSGARTYNAFVEHEFNLSGNLPLGSMAIGLSNQVGRQYYAAQAAAYYNSYNSQTDNWVTMDATNTAPAYYNELSMKMPWRFELDGIGGYYFMPSWLAYGKLGATTEQAQLSFRVGQYQEEPASTPSSNMTLYGLVLGLGVQHSFSQHWQAGVEGDYVRFFNNSDTVSTAFKNDPNPVSYTFNLNPQLFILEATLSYSF
jgi:opacity protein-like surface antigen